MQRLQITHFAPNCHNRLHYLFGIACGIWNAEWNKTFSGALKHMAD